MPFLRQIVSGALWDEAQQNGGSPIKLNVVLCNFLPAFIPKGHVGRHDRAIARNGLVLLMHSLKKGQLDGVRGEMNLRIWNRCILPGSRTEPYGILMLVRATDPGDLRAPRQSLRKMTFGPLPAAGSAMSLELGGNNYLSIQ